MSPPTDPQMLRLGEQWREEFEKVMEVMADLRPTMQAMPEPPDHADALWWKQPFDAAPGAVVWIGVAEETWSALGEHILAAAGIESASPQELRSTCLEVIRQSLGALATTMGGTLGREVVCQDGGEESPGDKRSHGIRISVTVKEQNLPYVAFCASPELLLALQGGGDAQAAAHHGGSEAGPGETAPDAHEVEEDVALPGRAYSTLNVLMDVEMPVSVSFGRTQVRVRDVLKLITGSIIELDRSISEPVEVIVNNCVIARGEVVVVEGNYGVRINEVMSRRERLQQSRKYLLPVHSHRL